MMKFFRKYKKHIAAFTLLSIVNQLIIPLTAVANNGGDVSAEYSKGGGVGNDLVNMYNGAFNYKVDLITLPGAGVSFPLTISYNSADVNMLSVPTCVGEGWSLNIPKISRSVKGVPDDFNGDKILYEYDMNPSVALSVDLSESSQKELWGLPDIRQILQDIKDQAGEESKPKIHLDGLGWDNYSGINSTITVSGGMSTPIGGTGVAASLDFSFHTNYGLSLRPSINTGFFDGQNLMDKFWTQLLSYGLYNGGLGMSGSTRQGFQGVNLSMGRMMNFSFANSGVPMVDLPTITTTKHYDFKPFTVYLGNNIMVPRTTANAPFGWYRGTKTTTSLARKFENRQAAGMLYKNYSGDHWIKDFVGNKTRLHKNMKNLPSSQIGKDVFIQTGGYGGVFTADVNEFKDFGNTVSVSRHSDAQYAGEVGFNVFAGVLFDIEAGGGKKAQMSTKSSGIWPSNDSEIKGKNSTGRLKLKASEVNIDDRENVYTTWLKEEPVAPIIKKRGAWGTDKRRYIVQDKYVKNEGSKKFFKEMKEKINSPDVNGNREDFKQKKSDQKLKYVQYLTTHEAFYYGNTRKNNVYFGVNYTPALWRLNKLAKRAHHIAEINVFERDQSHLIYGEPVYNIKKIDATFSFNSSDGDNQNKDDKLGLNQYEADLETGKNFKDGNLVAGSNGQGLLTKVTTPEYATAWLIKKIPSRDYEDRTNDGVTRDDKGDCVEFDYFSPWESADTKDQVYNWRFPYEKVDVMQGIKDYPRDNMGSFTAGQNELKYVKSIETKTHHLEFIYDANYNDFYPANNVDQLRKDGYPVDDLIKGGITTRSDLGKYEKTWKLIEVRLYSKGANGLKETNLDNYIQKVVLEQDYSLCQNHPSNIEGKGKLTLNKVYSLYRQSSKGEDYKYEFDYFDNNTSTTSNNPTFDRFNVDRWGDYQENTDYIDNSYPYKELPYTNQFDDEGIEPAPWCLKKIKLPSGADLNVDYEKNEYAYSNSKIATVFYDVLSTKKFDNIDNPASTLDSHADRTTKEGNFDYSSIINKNRLIVQLDNEIFEPSIEYNTDDKLKNRFLSTYLKGVDKVFIRAYVDMGMDIADYERDNDWVDVEAEVEKSECKVYEVNGNYYAEIKLKKEPPHDFLSFYLNPIRKGAFEKLKQIRTDLLRGQPTPTMTFQELLALSSFGLKEILGPSNQLISKLAASRIRLNGWSKVALKTPDLRKQGGGYRVKSITLSDNWVNDESNKTVDDNYKYILEYDYDAYNEEGELLGSSGIANEPMNGQLENGDFSFSTYLDSKGWLFEGDLINSYGHPMDIHKGGPSIGYENVVVRTKFPSSIDFPIAADDVRLSQPPYQEYKFYSQRQYPTLIKETDVARGKPYKFQIPLSGFVDLNFFDEAYAQGYTVVTNDMSGKLKSLITRDRDGNPINGQNYFYKNDNIYNAAPFGEELASPSLGQLNNDVMLIKEGKEIEAGQVGISTEVWTYTNENKNVTKSDGVNTDISGGIQFVAAPPLFAITNFFLMPLAYVPVVNHRDATKFAVTNKVIHKSGILEKVETIKDESIIETNYLGYDKLTGKVLLSSVDNEFGDPIYKFSHPGYWEYEDFKAVENSIDQIHANVISDGDGFLKRLTGSGVIEVMTDDKYDLHDGDLVEMEWELATGPYFTFGYISKEGNKFQIINYHSDAPFVNTVSKEIRVIKSGYTNLVDASVGEEVGQIVKASNGSVEADIRDYANNPSSIPVSVNPMIMEFDAEKILNVSAVTFKEDWDGSCCNPIQNRYRNGTKNYWRPYQSFVYHGERDYSSTLHNGTRNSGVFKNYEVFDWSKTYPLTGGSNWILSSNASYFDYNGNLLEQEDALGLYSSSGYGYGGNLVQFVSGNSKFNESGFDGFEDYKFYRCSFQNGFTFFYYPSIKLDDKIYHSGNQSLLLESNQKVNFEVELECEE